MDGGVKVVVNRQLPRKPVSKTDITEIVQQTQQKLYKKTKSEQKYSN